MHSVWFSRDSIGIVSFLRARRSGRTQKRFKHIKSLWIHFPARSKLHWPTFEKIQSLPSACDKFRYVFHFPVNLCWRPCWIFLCVNLISKYVQSWKISKREKHQFDVHFQFPGQFVFASVMNFCISKASKVPLLWGATLLQLIISKVNSQNLHTACWILVVR